MKTKLEKIRKEQEFFKNINIDSTSKDTHASIDLRNHELDIKYNTDWTNKILQDKQTREYLKKKNIANPLETLVIDLLFHEIGHRGSRKYIGAPQTPEKLSKYFLEPMQEITKEKNKKKLHYFANTNTDQIVDITNKKFGKEGLTTQSGSFLFFKEQGLKTGKFSRLYEAYARLSLYLYGDKFDKALLNQHLSFDAEVNKAIQNYLKRTGISQIKTTLPNGNIVQDKEKIREFMMNENNWENIARIYAEEFGKFMQEPQKESLFGSGGSAGNNSDSQTGDSSSNPQSNGNSDEDESNSPSNEPSDNENNNFNQGDGFGEELNGKETKKKIISGRNGGKMPGWMTNFEYLEALYELRAQDKIFELVVPRMKSKTYPLVNLTERFFDMEEDSASDILGLDFDKSTKSLQLVVGNNRYNIEAKVKDEISRKPDFVLAILDTSDSMKEPMPKGPKLGDIVNPKAPSEQHWRYNSKMDVALVNYFMALARFEELKVRDADAYFVNFSYHTLLSRGLRDSKREALHPQFGGTTLDINKIRNVMARPGTLLFTISDGEITNYQDVLNEITRTSETNPCFHIQIGAESNYSRGLLERGLHRKLVQEEKELNHFAVNLIDSIYGAEK